MSLKYLCGTCLNYYSIADKLRAGTVSNMFDILGVLVNAGHVVSLLRGHTMAMNGYFDNAATSFPKPDGVVAAMTPR